MSNPTLPQVGFNDSVLTETTYAGTPVVLQPNSGVFSSNTIGGLPEEQVDGQPWYSDDPSSNAFVVSIANGGGELSLNFAALYAQGYSLTFDVADPSLVYLVGGQGEIILSGFDPSAYQLAATPTGYVGQFIASQLTVSLPSAQDAGLSNVVLNNLTYVNTSSDAPTSAQISFQALQTSGYGPVFSPDGYSAGPTSFIETVNVLPLPAVVTETATVTSGGAVSGTAGTSGSGALAGDSDANAGYTLSVSAVSGGTLGSAVHGTYGDLTLNIDGSFSYAAGATSTELAAISAASGQVTDAFTYSVSDGHGGVTSSTLDIDLDATKPSISSIGFSPSSGDLAVHASETITLSLANVGAIDIAGNGPTLTLNDGGTATYDAAASTSTSWVFDYTVASGDTNVASLAVNSVNLNGTTLSNPSGAATVTSLPVTGVAQSGPQIDTTTPTFTAVTENPSSGEIGLNTKVTFTLTLNDPVTVDTTNGAPTLTLNDNGIATYDAAASTSTSLVFDYTLTGTDIANVTSLQATLFNSNNAVITNGAGTAANVSLAGLSQSGPTIDLPQVTGGFAAPSSGTYGAGETMALFVEFNKAVTATGNITLSLNDGGTATLDAADTALLQQNGYVVFDYHVAPTDHDVSSLAVTGIDLHGGSILDSLGDEAQFSGTLPTFSNIEVDTGIACYCRGTLIEVARGQKSVEALNIGDKVRTASGALRPIKWIGRRSYAGRFIMGRSDILPICIKAGALADNVPARDLWVSPNHAMYLSGVLIEAKDLVNGVSIAQTAQVESVEYFHIELETHDVIIAEGALSETFIDDDSRGMFHNACEYETLYQKERSAPAHYCAPRLNEGYEVEAVRGRLALRAGLVRADNAPQLGALRGYIDLVSPTGIAGWAQNSDVPDAPVCLDIFTGGELIGQVLASAHREDLKRAGLGSGRHGFTFTPPAGTVFSPEAVEVRRSLDGAALKRSRPASGARPNVTVHRRAARG
jgi:VCBS repeat-containing protein